MHHFVYRNSLPETLLEFARFDEADGHALIGFLRSGQVPDAIRDPNHPRFQGVIGQSMKAPLLFLMRELRRLSILDERFDSACYYLNSPARRIAARLGWIWPQDQWGGEFADLVHLSGKVHARVREELPEEMRSFFDLPLQLLAKRNI